MKSTLLLAVPAVILGMAAASPARAGEGSCDYQSCTPTFVTVFELVQGGSVPGVPFPTRRGAFISHFDEGGAPRSLVTPVESSLKETLVEVPCTPEYEPS